MINREKLQEYKERYNPLEERILHSEVVKEDLERQKEKTRQDIKDLDDKIIKKKSKLRLDIIQLREELKSKYVGKSVVGLIASVLLGGFVIFTYPVTKDLKIFDYIVKYGFALYSFLMVSGASIFSYYYNISNLPTYNDEDIQNPEVDRLIEERDLAVSREKDINESLKVIINYMSSLKGTKEELESLIWNLFYPDDTRDERETPSLGLDKWLDIDSEDERVEIGPALRRTKLNYKLKGE